MSLDLKAIKYGDTYGKVSDIAISHRKQAQWGGPGSETERYHLVRANAIGRVLEERTWLITELESLRAAAKLAIEELIRRPMGVVPDSAVACLKMIGDESK